MPIFPVMISSARPSRPLAGCSSAKQCAGFTLVELAVTIVIIGLISAVAVPQLLPLLIFSELDGQSRRLAHYGAAVIAEAALFGAEYTVYVDLDEQEIYTTQLIYPEGNEDEQETTNHLGLFAEARQSGNYSSEDLSEMLAAKAQGNQRLSGSLPDDFDPAEADVQMKDSFETRYRQMLFSRSKNVKHDAGFLSEIGPLFEDDFQLSWEEPYEEELTDAVLARFRMLQGVHLEAVTVNNSAVTRGLVEIQVSALGLEAPVLFLLRNDDDDYVSVKWDPMTGRGSAREGRWNR